MKDMVAILTMWQVPLYITCMAGEWYALRRWRPQPAFDYKNAGSDIGCGLTYLLVESLFHGTAAASYILCYEYFGNRQWWSSTLALWLCSYILIDLIFYFWHRLHHRVNILWGIHSVHHQGHQFTLALALRQPALEPISWFVFYLPLAALGIPFEVYGVCHLINRAYQFFMHTEMVPPLGIYEWLFCTPSQHRVHHGVLPHYLDKNYGGTFCVWDRMFGTFQKEREVTPYGVTTRELPINPLGANFRFFRRLATAIGKAGCWKNKACWVVNPPDRLPEEG
jgi:sterol desaturase/sphingolipid hydroxylase (fatty acid hydroxylase superfamily)